MKMFGKLRPWLIEHGLFPKRFECFILSILYHFGVPLSNLNRVKILRYKSIRKEEKLQKQKEKQSKNVY